MKIFLSSILFLLSFTFACHCQSLDSLSILIKDIQRGKNDSIRFASNEIFSTALENMLNEAGSFSRNFESLTNVSIKSDEDNTFRIFTWAVPHYDGNAYDYFGYIQLHSAKSDTLIKLKDSTNIIFKPQSEKLNTDRWLGAVYYDIIPVEHSGKKYYTLLGWKGKNVEQTEKIIDVLYFNANQAKFGYPLFKAGSVFHNRILFTYNSQATMVLRFDKKFNGIVFDHLATDKKKPTMLSGPDGTYDAFKLKKGKWILYKDVDVRTKWDPVESLPEPPTEGK